MPLPRDFEPVALVRLPLGQPAAHQCSPAARTPRCGSWPPGRRTGPFDRDHPAQCFLDYCLPSLKCPCLLLWLGWIAWIRILLALLSILGRVCEVSKAYLYKL